ncbi:MAG: hypothetical protein IJ189_02390 [Clostridia bacterium]|nr:hypothetical protein [Clostridia bacterium]
MQPPQGPYQQPQYPGYLPPSGESQWTQRPLPGQDANGMYGAPSGQTMPGQVPPPANIAPDPSQPPVYGYAPPAYAGNPVLPGQMPGAAAQPQGQQEDDDAQTARVVRPGAAPVYTMPKTGIPAPQQKRSKVPYILLALVIVGFGTFAALRSMAPRQGAYGYVSFGALSSRYAGDAVLVRSETVYAQEGVSQIDYIADEGADIKRGDTVATIYTSGFSSREWTTLQNYRNQIKEYHKVLIGNAAADTRLLSLTTQVRERALEAQRLVQGARGSLNGQETLLQEAMQSLRIYMRQKYPDDQKLSRLYDEENTQLQRISTWSKQFAAVSDGLVSFYTDGYEPALNMTNYGDYTPAQVRSMYNGNAPQVQGQTVSRNSTDIYRLVRKEPWAVLLLCSDQEWTPVTGRSYEMLIENFDNIIVHATVESFTRSGGELLVRLLVENTDALSNVLYIRSCKVQVGESVNTLMVPSRAIYIQNGRKGVVIATEGGEYWAGVEIVSDDGTSAYVIPENAGVLYDGVPVRLF